MHAVKGTPTLCGGLTASESVLLLVQLSEAEQQYVNTGQRVRKEFEAKLEEVRRAGEEDIHLRMDAGTKRIMQQNRSLQEELRIHIEVMYPCCCCCTECLGCSVAAAVAWGVCSSWSTCSLLSLDLPECPD